MFKRLAFFYNEAGICPPTDVRWAKQTVSIPGTAQCLPDVELIIRIRLRHKAFDLDPLRVAETGSELIGCDRVKLQIGPP